MTDRPKRRAIPMAVKRAVARRQFWHCHCGCGTTIRLEPGSGIDWDHHPALRLRDTAPDGLDYIPPQHSPDHIVARCKESHRRKTSGSGATTAGTDIGAIKKERRRGSKPRFKKKIPSRKMQSGPFQKRPA